MGISLHEIARETRVPLHHLESIEAERFEALPPPVYTRGFVVSLADTLSLDPVRVSSDYMEKYRIWSDARTGKKPRHALLHGRSHKK
jgi:cytoskeletal protein RodZ